MQASPRKALRAPSADSDLDASALYSPRVSMRPLLQDFSHANAAFDDGTADMHLEMLDSNQALLDVGEMVKSLIDDLEMEGDAPVGCRKRKGRLVRKRDLEGFCAEGEQEEEGVVIDAKQLELEIKRDGEKIRLAAQNLGLKETLVKVFRRELVVEVDERGEAVGVETKESRPSSAGKPVASNPELAVDERGEAVGVETKESRPSSAGKPVASNPGLAVDECKFVELLDEDSDEDSDEDADMVLRRPDIAVEPKEKGKAPMRLDQPAHAEPMRRQAKDDEEEWIRADQLDTKKAGPQYKDVYDDKLMWRVPDMKTSLLNHQVLGVDWMLRRETSEKAPKGGLVADAMGLGKVGLSITSLQFALTLPDHPIHRHHVSELPS
jgi:hypothetical protein